MWHLLHNRQSSRLLDGTALLHAAPRSTEHAGQGKGLDHPTLSALSSCHKKAATSVSLRRMPGDRMRAPRSASMCSRTRYTSCTCKGDGNSHRLQAGYALDSRTWPPSSVPARNLAILFVGYPIRLPVCTDMLACPLSLIRSARHDALDFLAFHASSPRLLGGSTSSREIRFGWRSTRSSWSSRRARLSAA